MAQYVDTPRGSVTHHFPGGKPQLPEATGYEVGCPVLAVPSSLAVLDTQLLK